MSTNVLVKSLAVFGVTILCSPGAHAATIVDLGPILNDSVSFPSTKTPGAGQMFQDFFEFTLPTGEYITASMSLSGPMLDQIPSGTGELTLSTWTSGGVAPVIPVGTLIEQATVSAPSKGGESAVVGSDTPFGDFEQAGKYFVEVSGTSGSGMLMLAVDGNVTTLAVPEPSTWAMFGIGFAGLAGLGLTRRRGNRESARYARGDAARSHPAPKRGRESKRADGAHAAHGAHPVWDLPEAGAASGADGLQHRPDRGR